jgi:hypothetical protein
MYKQFDLKPSRRQFLAGAGGALALTAAYTTAHAGQGADLWQSADARSIVLHDAGMALPADVVARLQANGANILALAADPVRLWRGEWGVRLQHPQTRLFGVTRWADLVIVRGLAAESRKHLRYEQLNAKTGYFSWLIA